MYKVKTQLYSILRKYSE